MHPWNQALLALQEIDARIAKIEARLAAAPAEKAAVQQELTDELTATSTAKERLREAEKAVKATELEIESLRSKMRDFQSKSAMIKNNDDYRAAMLQADTCKQQVSQLEDRELEQMAQVEAAKRGLAAEEKKLAEAKQRAAAKAGDIDTAAAGATRELERLRQERAPLAEAIDPPVRERYERIWKKRRHPDDRAFVPVRNGACGACNMNLPAQTRVNVAKGKKDACCDTCSRLLYAED
ncbi:MAG: hypothetical protein WC708_03285 [Lentisphaeria bacterium]